MNYNSMSLWPLNYNALSLWLSYLTPLIDRMKLWTQNSTSMRAPRCGIIPVKWKGAILGEWFRGFFSPFMSIKMAQFWSTGSSSLEKLSKQWFFAEKISESLNSSTLELSPSQEDLETVPLVKDDSPTTSKPGGGEFLLWRSTKGDALNKIAKKSFQYFCSSK